MLVRDVMTPAVRAVPADASIREVVITLADAGISAAPVLDDAERPIGVISVTDLLQAEAEARTREEREILFERMTARELMTPRPLTIGPDATVREAAQQMLYAEIRRLFVEAEGRLVGVVSEADLIRALALARV